MKNNKNRLRDREKTNPELRKMKPKDNSDVGIKEDGQHTGTHDGDREKGGLQ